MRDAIAGEPDTSEIPVLPKFCVCTSAQSTSALAFRRFGTSHATDCFTTCCVFAKCACSHTIMVSTSASQTPSMQRPDTPHVDVQPEFPPPASSADDDPMPLPHVEDTPPWVCQEPETWCISTEQDTPVTIRHPYRFFRHGRRQTCPLVIQLFRLRLGLMKLHSRSQQFMKMFYHRSLRLTRLHL